MKHFLRTVALFMATCGIAAAGAVPANIAIQQVISTKSELRFYVDVTGPDGNAATVTPQQIRVMGPDSATATAVRGMAAEDGTGYIVLLDVSLSTRRQAGEMRDALQRWIRQMSSNDRMAIVTFGDAVEVKQDFTNAQPDLLNAADINPSDPSTHLYQAIRKGTELANRLDPGLPERRVLIVVSDGINSEHDTGLTENDAVDAVQKSGIPVFAFDSGSSHHANGTRCSQTLARLASISDGGCLKLQPGVIGAGFDQVHAQIQRVLVVDASCSKCARDGVPRDFWIEAQAGSTAVRSEKEPVVVRLDVPPPPISPPAPSPCDHVRCFVGFPWYYWLLAVIGIVAIALLILYFLSQRKSASSGSPASGKGVLFVSSSSAIVTPRTQPSPQPQVAPNVVIRLVVVGGQHRGKEYENPLRQSLTLGRAPECDFVIDFDGTVADRQCEFLWNGDRVAIRDLAANGNTVVGGGVLTGERVVDDQEVIGVGATDLRILIDHGR